MAYTPKGNIQVCIHCDTQCGQKAQLCPNCRKVDDRRAMDEENRKILNNPNWHIPCTYDVYKKQHPGEAIKKEETITT